MTSWHRKEWEAIRNAPGATPEWQIRMGLRLLHEMCDDPCVRAAVEEHRLREELRAKQTEEKRLASMSAVQRLVHAAMHGETEVALTPEQGQQVSGASVEVGYCSEPKVSVDELPEAPERCTWLLIVLDDGCVRATLDASTLPRRGAHAKTLANDDHSGVTY